MCSGKAGDARGPYGVLPDAEIPLGFQRPTWRSGGMGILAALVGVSWQPFVDALSWPLNLAMQFSHLACLARACDSTLVSMRKRS